MSFPLDIDGTQPRRFEILGGVFHVRHVTPKKQREIRESIGLPGERPAGEQLNAEQEDRLRYALIDYMLADWEDVTIGGVPAACTLDNKKTLVDNHGTLGARIRMASLEAYSQAVEEAQVELGNSSGSSTSSDEPSPTPAPMPALTSADSGRRAPF